jgi:uncharacterized protein YvpB
VKTTAFTIRDFENLTGTAAPDTTIEGSLRMLLLYQGEDVSIDKLSVNDKSAYSILQKYSKSTPVRLTGITLEDALYYVTKGRPVIAMTDINKAVVIYGYDAFNIMIYDPATGKKVKMGIQDSTQLFQNAGNIFLSYLGQ